MPCGFLYRTDVKIECIEAIESIRIDVKTKRRCVIIPKLLRCFDFIESVNTQHSSSELDSAFA